jgi:hypothetical protein
VRPAAAQEVLYLQNESRLIPSDIAVLEVPEPRDDLPCMVHPVKARLGFDLRFHAGYEVEIPLDSLAGEGNQLSILFRVVPGGADGKAVYFTQKVSVPAIKEDAKGDALLQGEFDLGEGRYKIDWLMRDRQERVCSYYWDEAAELDGRDRDVALVVKPGEIRPFQSEQFVEEPPVRRTPDHPPLSVKLMVNFAPQLEGSSALQPIDTAAVVSLLRCFWREPRISRYSVVAFNLNSQKVLYRQEDTDWIDFQAIGDALKNLDVGRVDLSTLANKNAEGDFLGGLLKQELANGSDPDAVIFVGPKATWGQKISSDLLKEIGRPGYPVFYMNCNLFPARAPWRDAIGSAVKFFDGEEYSITSPRDLWSAVTDVITRIVKLRQDRRAALSSSR